MYRMYVESDALELLQIAKATPLVSGLHQILAISMRSCNSFSSLTSKLWRESSLDYYCINFYAKISMSSLYLSERQALGSLVPRLSLSLPSNFARANIRHENYWRRGRVWYGTAPTGGRGWAWIQLRKATGGHGSVTNDDVGMYMQCVCAFVVVDWFYFGVAMGEDINIDVDTSLSKTMPSYHI